MKHNKNRSFHTPISHDMEFFPYDIGKLDYSQGSQVKDRITVITFNTILFLKFSVLFGKARYWNL